MEKFDIIIQAGQSNAEGCGRGPVEKEYVPTSDILYLEAKKFVEHTPERVIVTYDDSPFSLEIAKERESIDGKVGDFSLTFARAYVDSGLLETGRKVLIIRAGVGGTGFKKHNWGLEDQLYLKMLEMVDYALELNEENRVVAFIWHQGEHDAFEGSDPDVYKEQVKTMVASVRKRYGVEKMPFIAGDFVAHWKNENISICEPIVAKLKEACNELGNAAFVETSDLLSNDQKTGNGDNIHFCRQSLHTLGERYFKFFCEAKE